MKIITLIAFLAISNNKLNVDGFADWFIKDFCDRRLG
jgi:hypothetical protein